MIGEDIGLEHLQTEFFDKRFNILVGIGGSPGLLGALDRSGGDRIHIRIAIDRHNLSRIDIIVGKRDHPRQVRQFSFQRPAILQARNGHQDIPTQVILGIDSQ